MYWHQVALLEVKMLCKNDLLFFVELNDINCLCTGNFISIIFKRCLWCHGYYNDRLSHLLLLVLWCVWLQMEQCWESCSWHFSYYKVDTHLTTTKQAGPFGTSGIATGRPDWLVPAHLLFIIHNKLMIRSMNFSNVSVQLEHG